MAHAGGRPTKYTSDILLQVGEYLATCGRENTELPTIEGLCIFLDIDDDTCVEWSKKYKEFSASVKDIMRRQKNQLINDGMYGGKEINSGMAIFLLKANHGMIETEKKILSGDSNSPLTVKVLDYGSNNNIAAKAEGSNKNE